MDNPGGVFARTYTEDTALIRTPLQWALAIGLLVLLYALPSFNNPYLMQWVNYTLIIIVAAAGLNLLVGYTGQLSLAHTAFVAVGAYTSAVLTTRYGVPFWFALPISGLVSGGVGMVFGLPSLRIKGVYLLMATMAAQVLIMYVFRHMDYFGSGEGLFGVPKPTLGTFTFRTEEDFYYIIITVAILAVLIARNIAQSRVGRAFISIRDNDIAAEMMGVSLYRYKLLAFFLGCFYAGIAGSLFVHLNGAVSPEMFTMDGSFWYLGYLIIGGAGTTLGPIFGVVLIQILNELGNNLVVYISGIVPSLTSSTGAVRAILFGAILAIFLIFEPRGLNHRWQMIKTYFKLWPFTY